MVALTPIKRSKTLEPPETQNREKKMKDEQNRLADFCVAAQNGHQSSDAFGSLNLDGFLRIWPS